MQQQLHCHGWAWLGLAGHGAFGIQLRRSVCMAGEAGSVGLRAPDTSLSAHVGSVAYWTVLI